MLMPLLFWLLLLVLMLFYLVMVVVLLSLILFHVACVCDGATLAAPHVFVVVHVLFFMLPFVMLLLRAAAVGIIGNDFAMVPHLMLLLLLLLLP